MIKALVFVRRACCVSLILLGFGCWDAGGEQLAGIMTGVLMLDLMMSGD